MRRWRGRRILVGALAGVGAVVVLLLAAGWYLSGILGCRGFQPVPRVPGVEVVAVADGAITLRATGLANECGEVRENWFSDGIWGIRWDGGFGQVGAIQSLDEAGGEVVREYSSADGAPPPGMWARLMHPFPVDPTRALGVGFTEVTYTSELGPLPAWATAGDHATWVIYVHGKGGQRTEGMRILKTAADLGMPGLLIDYRNDQGAPADPTGKYQYGLTEWRDLEGAVRYALAHGAHDVVLVGYSMGGAIAINFLLQSDLAHEVSALVLDSPMLDFSATVDLGARNRGIPRSVTAFAKVIAGWRLDVDWSALDYLNRADDIDVPILLFHSETDGRVPVSTSDELAEVRPDIVTYERYETGAHVGGWNLDRRRYEQAVRRFVSGVTNQAGSG